MEVQVEQVGQFGRKLSINIPNDDVKKTFDKVTKEFAKEAKIPGFRPGKIPSGVVAQHYGPQIKNAVRESLIEQSLIKAIHENKLAPVGAPRIHMQELERDVDFKYTAEFEVQPEIELKTYKGLKVAKVKIEVNESEIDTQLENMRTQAAQLVPVLIRDTVEKGDIVLVDYEGTMGGIPFKGGKAENALIEIGGSTYLPQISEGLLGAKVPGERVVQVDFPEDYNAKDLAGKPASFHIRLREIKKKELPALDDEFARDVGEENLVALRERLEREITAQKNHEAEGEQRQKLLKALADANPFNVPQSMIDEQAARMVDAAHARLAQMMGRQFELGEEEKKNLLENNKEGAELHVRSGMLLFEIAKAEKLEVSDQEIETEIENIIKGFAENAQRVQSYYNDPDNHERLRYRLLEEKVIKLLLDNAEFFEDTNDAKKPEASAEADTI
ncbi:MAG: trigger factor [Deltaproteobacteria bacterium]|nr:trigger factor [Deltaproteobacteria bacterium]